VHDECVANAPCRFKLKYRLPMGRGRHALGGARNCVAIHIVPVLTRPRVSTQSELEVPDGAATNTVEELRISVAVTQRTKVRLPCLDAPM
jgi:hypothetical protein